MHFWKKQPTRLSIILSFRFILKYCIKNYFLESKIPKTRTKLYLEHPSRYKETL